MNYYTKLEQLAKNADLLLYELFSSDLDNFDIFYVEEGPFFCVDTGNSQQVVFSLDEDNGLIHVLEDTDNIGIGTTFKTVEEFLNNYQILTGTAVEAFEALDKIKEDDSLVELFGLGKKKLNRYIIGLTDECDEVVRLDILIKNIETAIRQITKDKKSEIVVYRDKNEIYELYPFYNRSVVAAIQFDAEPTLVWKIQAKIYSLGDFKDDGSQIIFGNYGAAPNKKKGSRKHKA